MDKNMTVTTKLGKITGTRSTLESIAIAFKLTAINMPQGVTAKIFMDSAKAIHDEFIRSECED